MVKDYDPKKYEQLPNKTYDSLSLTDLVCHVCYNLGYPPVTLTCNHLLCYECYEDLKVKGEMVCPACRKRFGHFDRRRKGNVINVSLKEAILRLFPQEVEVKLNGQGNDKISENILEDGLEQSRRISLPGEVNRDYLLAIEQENRQREKEREADQMASQKCAEEILRKEEELANELKKREEEDAEVARSLFQQEEEDYHKVKREKEKLEQQDKELAMNLVKEQGEARMQPPKIRQMSLDSYLDNTVATDRNKGSDVLSSGPDGEESIVVPSSSVKTEAEPWFEELYLQDQIEKDRLIALEMQEQFEKEIKERNKKRGSDYTLRSSAKKKKPDN